MNNARARIHKAAKAQYAAIPNAIAQSRTLSPNARAVLVELLSRPDDWEARAEQLAYEHMSVRTVYRVLNELIDAGYVVRAAIKGEDGRFKYWRYDVFDAPVEPVAKNHEMVLSAEKADASPRGESMLARTHFVDDGTHTKPEKEERETNAPAEITDAKVVPFTQQPDGGAKVYTLIEAWLDAWDIQEPRYRKGVHRTEGKHAGRMADMGATPDDIAAMCAERRSRGKQPDEAKLAFLASDFVAWKSRAAKSPPIAVVETTEQVTAREAQREAERREWRKEQGLA